MGIRDTIRGDGPSVPIQTTPEQRPTTSVVLRKPKTTVRLIVRTD